MYDFYENCDIIQTVCIVFKGDTMIRVFRELIYSNGKISVANTFDKIEIVVCKENEIVETKLLPIDIWNNKPMIENMINSMKGKHALMHIEDDCTKVLSNSGRRYVIRGTGSCIHVLYFNDHSNYIKQTFLGYNYSEVSMEEYAGMFGM